MIHFLTNPPERLNDKIAPDKGQGVKSPVEASAQHHKNVKPLNSTNLMDSLRRECMYNMSWTNQGITSKHLINIKKGN